MNKTIILARPHNVIVTAVKEFLIRNEYIPLPLSNLDDLNKIPSSNKIYGAVISTAVNSVVKESFIDVFIEIRKKYPELPVIFATLGEIKFMSKFLTQSLEKLIPNVNLIDFDNKNFIKPLNSDSFLLINKENITNDKMIISSDKAIKNYFK